MTEEDNKKEGKFWKAEAGSSVSGILTDKKKNIGKYKSMLYVLTNKDEENLVWGKVDLNYKMKKAKIGDKITITMTGYEDSGEYKKGLYNVEIHE